MNVTVTIEGGKITAVDVDAPMDAASLGAAAINTLPDAIIEAQGIEGVDKSTGASLTSQAIFDAVADCLMLNHNPDFFRHDELSIAREFCCDRIVGDALKAMSVGCDKTQKKK